MHVIFLFTSVGAHADGWLVSGMIFLADINIQVGFMNSERWIYQFYDSPTVFSPEDRNSLNIKSNCWKRRI